MKNLFFCFLLFSFIQSSGNPNENIKVKFRPIQHASLVIEYGELTIFIDPAGDMDKMKKFPSPDLVLITHTHGDHFNPEMLDSIKSYETIVIGNRVAIDQLGYGIFLINGESKTVKGVRVEAVPMYNTTQDRFIHHQKGDGNGYILTLGDERVYISGDTEDTKEVRDLKNIDHAFLCMNLPFTMTPEQAASAVLDFNPKKVYPYHYRQSGGYADIEKFKMLVNKGGSTEVIFLDWYGNNQ